MSNPFEHRRPTELEDKSYAEAVRHFAEHLKQFPTSREAVERLLDRNASGLAGRRVADRTFRGRQGS